MDEITELVLNAQNGNESALEILLKKFEPLINSVSKKYSNMCFSDTKENEEFISESRLAFYKAVSTYDVSRGGATFGLYAKRCIENKLISCVRKLNSKKRRKSEEIANDSVESPQDALIRRENEKKLLEISDKILSKYEKKIFLLYLRGNKPRDIVKIAGKDKRSVDNALYRIKSKLKREIKYDT